MNPAEAYILNQPEPYRSILLHLQLIVESTITTVQMKFKWGIPCFYIGKQPICYLNASHRGAYVDIAFWNAAQLTKHVELMVAQNRKVVKSFRYSSLADINDTVLVEVLQEADSLTPKRIQKKG